MITLDFLVFFSIVLSKLKEHECKLLASEDKLRNFCKEIGNMANPNANGLQGM